MALCALSYNLAPESGSMVSGVVARRDSRIREDFIIRKREIPVLMLKSFFIAMMSLPYKENV